MKNKRKGLSKKLRFEVFKRDGFTCQYCGRSAPDVILEVDHIKSVKNGGDNDIMNLITSCFDCNRGKGKRKLSEKEEIKKQTEELKKLNEKREQLKMMLKWKKELENFENEEVDNIVEKFEVAYNKTLTQFARNEIKKLIKKYGFENVYDATEIAVNTEIPEKAFSLIGRICFNKKVQKEKPYLKDVNYIGKILKNRFGEANLIYRLRDRVGDILSFVYDTEDYDYEVSELIYFAQILTKSDFMDEVSKKLKEYGIKD